MPYEEKLAERIRGVLTEKQHFTERKMFGGIAFMLNGNMCCGVQEDILVLRLGNELVEQALKEKHTRPMDFTGRVIKSMVYVTPTGYKSDQKLSDWIEQAISFTESLPAKNVT